MNALELKLATAIARDFSIDLSDADDTPLFGCALPDFQPVVVSIRCVAKSMRWQCAYIFQRKDSPDWDWEQHNEDLHSYRKKVTICDLNVPELRAWLVDFVVGKLNADVADGVLL